PHWYLSSFGFPARRNYACFRAGADLITDSGFRPGTAQKETKEDASESSGARARTCSHFATSATPSRDAGTWPLLASGGHFPRRTAHHCGQKLHHGRCFEFSTAKDRRCG